MRKTKIVATIGPKNDDLELLEQLVEQGVNIFRLNLSHGEQSWHQSVLDKIEQIQEKRGVEVLLDTRGPEIRLGDFAGQIKLQKGDEFCLVSSAEAQDIAQKKIYVPYPALSKNIQKGDRVAIDGGMLFAEVVDISPNCVICVAESDWVLSSRRHVNLPGERVELPTIPEKDRLDLEYFAQDKRVNYVALSFTRTALDVAQARKLIPQAKIIAKIENFEGVNNFDDILKEADGIMVARGDLGVEMPLEQVPVLQRQMVRQVRHSDKFVIVATEMLESMVKSPRPTRAEVSDVATAVWEEADAVMLSEETAMGEHPLETVAVMRRVIEYTEEGMTILN